jgi:hypothetical protein
MRNYKALIIGESHHKIWNWAAEQVEPYWENKSGRVIEEAVTVVNEASEAYIVTDEPRVAEQMIWLFERYKDVARADYKAGNIERFDVARKARVAAMLSAKLRKKFRLKGPVWTEKDSTLEETK